MVNILFLFNHQGVKRTICRNTPPNRFLYKVNIEAVKKEKEKYATENSWVSSNDVLCDYLFTQVWHLEFNLAKVFPICFHIRIVVPINNSLKSLVHDAMCAKIKKNYDV